MAEIVTQEEFSSSEKQAAALTRILQAAAAGKDVSAHWPSLLRFCVAGCERADVRRLAYALLPLCRSAPLAAWDAATSAIASDLCSFDPAMRVAALTGLPHFPLALFIARERDAPGQIWIGGGKDEAPEVHVAALKALASLAFREQFLEMEHLVYDSWNFVVDHAMATDVTFYPAMSLVASLFAYASGFGPVPDVAGAEARGDVAAALKPVAMHVLAALLPHLETLVDTVNALPDVARPPCVYALTHIALAALQLTDDGVLGTPRSDSQPHKLPAVSMARCDIVRLIGKHYISWLDSTHAGLEFQTARNLLVLAPHVPADGAQWTIAALGVLVNLMRGDSPLLSRREIVDTIIPVVPRVSRVYATTLLAQLVQAIGSFPERDTRLALLVRMFTVAIDQGKRALAKASIVQQLFHEQSFATIWRDEKRRTFAEELLLALLAVFEDRIDACAEAAAKLFECTTGCLQWSVREHALPVEQFIRFAHNLFQHLQKKKGLESVQGSAFATLREIFSSTLSRVQSDAVALQLIYLLICRLPARDLEAEERHVPLLAALKTAYLKIDELDKYTAAVSKAKKSGRLLPPALERPRLVQPPAALQCLLVLASRVPALIQPCYAIVDELSRHFADSRKVFERLQSLKLRVYSFKTHPPPLHPPPATFVPLIAEPLEIQAFSRNDDALSLALYKGISQLSAKRRQQHQCVFEEISGMSDMFSISAAHKIAPELRRLTFFLKVTNATASTLNGGVLTMLTPEHVRPWFDDTPQLTESILRTETHGTREITFTTRITRFAPISVRFRFSVAVPEPEEVILPESDGSATAATSPSTTPPLASLSPLPGINKQRTTSAVSRDTTDPSDKDVLPAAMWPDVFTEEHVIGVLEMLEPLPLSAAQFMGFWPRLPAAHVEDYVVAPEEFSASALSSRMECLPVSKVFHRTWAEGCFEAAFACRSWFDDLVCFIFTGQQESPSTPTHVRLQLRTADAQALLAMLDSLPSFLGTIFASSAVLLQDSQDPSSSPFF